MLASGPVENRTRVIQDLAYADSATHFYINLI
jgi:hypothetical protein